MRKVTLGMIIFWSVLALLILAALIGGVFFTANRRPVVSGEIPSTLSADTAAQTESAETPERPAAPARSAPPENADKLFDQSLPISDVQNLLIDMTSDEVNLYPAEDNTLRVVQYGVNLNDERIIALERRGSTLAVTRSSYGWQLFTTPGYSRSYIDIYLPQSYHQALEIDLTSGSVTMHDDRQLSEFSIDITSGDIDVKHIEAQSATVEMTSGNVQIEGLSVDSFDMDCTSGNIRVDSAAGSGKLWTTSGSIHLERLELTDTLSLELTSGSINVGLAGNPNLQFKASRTSGSIDTYFPTNSEDNGRELFGSVGSAPYKRIEIDSTSGNVNITAVN